MNSFIKGTLVVAALAGIGAGGHFGYKAINNKNKEINNLKTEISQIKEDNESLKTQLEEKDNQLAEKEEKLEEVTKSYLTLKDVEIPRIQNELATKTSLLETANGQISTLNTQKVSLLSAVTEIDNVINETEDAVEIETLEARKNAILVQIDSLNTQISSLESEKQKLQTEVDNLKVEKQNLQTEVDNLKSQKTQLENEIASLNTQLSNLRTAISQLENATGIEYKTSKKSIMVANLTDFVLRDNLINLEDVITLKETTIVAGSPVCNFDIFPGSSIKQWFNSFFSHEFTQSYYSRSSLSYYQFTLNGIEHDCIEQTNIKDKYSYDWSNISVYYNNVLCSDLNDLADNTTYIIYSIIDENDKLSIYISDINITGKYIADNGRYFDFDTKTYVNDDSGIVNSYMNGAFRIGSDGVEFSYSKGSQDLMCIFKFNSISSFEYDGQTFTKSEG